MEINRRGLLSLQIGEGTSRPLVHLGEHTFHPGGAASVRVRFEVQGGAVKGVWIEDGAVTLSARRRQD